jgi:fibronectin-binding autotransporter adhesin
MPAIAQDLSFQDTTFRDSFEEAAIWISEVDGNWSDGFNWESGSPPVEGQSVIIRVPTDVVVTIDAGPLVVSSINSEESLMLNTTLTVNGPILNNGGLTIAGELINAYVLPVSSGIGNRQALTAQDGLTLDGAFVVSGGSGSSFSTASLNGNTPYTINGTGVFFLGSGNNGIAGNADITLGPDITLSGYVGRFSPGSVLINEGTVHSNLPGELIFGAAGMTVINNGVMKGTDSGSIGIDGNWSNNGSITIQDGGVLSLYGTYDNQGTMFATDSTVNLNGEFTMAGLGSFSRTGGTVTIQGTLNNAKGLVLDSTTGSWLINGGRINGGVIETLDGVSLSAQNRKSILDDVTVDGRVSIGTSSSIAFLNDLTVNGQVVIAGSTGSLYASASIDSASPVTIDGTGEVFFGGGDNFLSGTADVTIGPDVTFRGQWGRISPGSVLTNQGTVHSDSPGTLTIGTTGMTVTNEGLIKGSGGGNLAVWGLASNDGMFELGPGSAVQAQETGYTQSASGALIVDIGGLGAANHGQLNSIDGVSLAGTLTVNLVNAYEPEIGDLFTIVIGTSINGTFDPVNGLVIGNGKQFSVNYNATDVTLEVVSTP